MKSELPQSKISIIGHISSPFREKFGIPRQSGLVTAGVSRIHMHPPFNQPEMFQGLESFSHIWLSFLFHAVMQQGWRPKVRPPRLGGNKQVGVFASRSPFRPNHLGLSAVELLEIDYSDSVQLLVRGADLLDATPIVDIKPYIPYADALPDAHGGFASAVPDSGLQVIFSRDAEVVLLEVDQSAELRQLITQVLQQDPRPAYRKNQESERVYGMLLDEYNIRWRVDEFIVEVVSLSRFSE